MSPLGGNVNVIPSATMLTKLNRPDFRSEAQFSPAEGPIINRDELIGAMREAERIVSRTFGQLSPQQIETQVHTEEGGWTAKQLLANLTSNDARIDMYLDREASTESLYGPEYWDWNQHWVNDRDGCDLADLLLEFRDQIASGREKLRSLDDAELDRLVPSSRDNPPKPISHWFEIVCARHRVRPAAGAREVLGLSAAP